MVLPSAQEPQIQLAADSSSMLLVQPNTIIIRIIVEIRRTLSMASVRAM